MNITIIGKQSEPKVLTVAGMEPGTVYRVWSPFDGKQPDRGDGQVCLKLSCDQSVLLELCRGHDPIVPHLTENTSLYFCGHPSVRVAEVYGKLVGVEVTPIL